MSNMTKAHGRQVAVRASGPSNITEVSADTVMVSMTSVDVSGGHGMQLDGSRVREEIGGLVDKKTLSQGFTLLLLVGGAWFGYRFLNASIDAIGIGVIGFFALKFFFGGKKA
jgi:hypothetical protein